ncbi:MAG: hypothetical protein HOP10_04335 [Chitinophagaceae bacterium]|nr:hypothetical protein [Chitinophagaceae bacterium]
MASSLRSLICSLFSSGERKKRVTLYLPVLYSAIIIGSFACKNTPSEGEKIMHDFDSVNKRLHSLNDKLDQSTDALYDSAAKKFGEVFLEQFRTEVTDGKNYMKSLKAEFIVACGGVGNNLPEDSYYDLDLSNQFFIKEKNGENLYYELTGLQKTFSSYNDDPELEEEIAKFTMVPTIANRTSTFAEAYFNKVPPVAAMTILSKFENDINVFEKKVIQQILKPANVTPR